MWLFDWIINLRKKEKYPDDIKDLCIKASKEARSCIESKGYRLGTLKNIEVVKVKGEKKINGYWSWRASEWNGMWVCGLSFKDKIKIGCNPDNGTEVSYETLKHEFGHVYLIRYYKDYYHNIIFKDCFKSWNNVSKPNKLNKNLSANVISFNK